jgi:Protein of unknown function (DUF1761)
MVVNFITISYMKFFGSILLSAIFANILGAYWYSPFGFGKIWQELSGVSAKQMNESMKKEMKKNYLLNFLASIVQAFILAYLISALSFNTIIQGATLGLIVGIGFSATITIGVVLWEGRPWKLYLLNNAYQISSFICMGAIIGGLI